MDVKFDSGTFNGNGSINYTVPEIDVLTNLTYSNRTLSDHEQYLRTLQKVTNIVLPILLVIMTLAIGTTFDFDTLKQTVRRPLGPLVGMVSQFVILPASAFGMAHALQLDAPTAIGLLVIACCPGGALSNMCAYWIDGNVTLSITMTTISTLMAICMMPLNIWLYSRTWSTGSVTVPYANIVLTLILLVVPTSIGIFIRWKWEKIANKVKKLATIFGALIIPVVLVTVIILYRHMFDTTWNVYVCGVALPVVGLTIGYLLAKMFRLNNTDARTISLETSIQNAPLAVVLITLSFPEMFAQIGVIPTIYTVSIIFETLLLVMIYKNYKRFATRPTNDNFELVDTVVN